MAVFGLKDLKLTRLRGISAESPGHRTTLSRRNSVARRVFVPFALRSSLATATAKRRMFIEGSIPDVACVLVVGVAGAYQASPPTDEILMIEEPPRIAGTARWLRK
jgi:hypothetical protein